MKLDPYNRRSLNSIFIAALFGGLLLVNSYNTSAQSACTTVVTTTGDSGAGSLREAINCANVTPGTDTISFNISGSGPQTISPLTALPTITGPVVIDGYTQPGSSANTNVSGAINAVLRIELNGAGAGFARALDIFASGTVVRGLVINRFSENGIVIRNGSNNIIEGNFIGTDIAGVADLGNTSAGVVIFSDNQLSLNNRIGGTTPAERNLISGNDNAGIFIQGWGNVVQGNLIGTDKNGTSALGNTQSGLGIFNASNNTIGGPTEAERNIISGNGNDGILIESSNFDFSTGNVVQGNYIGVGVSGTQPLGNGSVFTSGDGIDIEDGASSSSVTGNTIAFNPSNGIEVQANRATLNRISANSIFSNGGLGIDLREAATASGLVTANDAGDADTGPNNLQNFPLLTSALTSGGSTAASGTLNSTPATAFRVEFFSNVACDPSGFGEGQTFIGFQNVTTDAGGNAPISFMSSTAVTPGQFVTTTAIDPAGNTSEFSQCIQVTGGALPPPTTPGAPTIGSATPGNSQATISFTAPVSNGGSPITSYTVTCNPGAFSAGGPGSPITVTGLSNGTTYSCSVTATNAIGTSAPSGSVIVTPTGAAPPPPPPPPGPATPIPTLSEWAMIVLTLLVALFGITARRYGVPK